MAVGVGEDDSADVGSKGQGQGHKLAQVLAEKAPEGKASQANMFWSVGSLTRHVFLVCASLAVVKRNHMAGRAGERGGVEATQ
ncbi:hypothetical protein BM1_01932 [Bipolaris maydis]|nr:hypothetical protein BM1_01932 [Bipolaris maydis]